MTTTTTNSRGLPRRRKEDAVAETSSASAPAMARHVEPRPDHPGRYLLALVALTLAGLAGIWRANVAYAPEMYDPKGSVAIAEMLARGNNFATFDLNINIREIRDAQFARMTSTPEVVILGASHWQEAHVGLLPGKKAFNAHIHRDYFEDMIGMVEIMVRHDRLPRQLIIAIRDLQFMPISKRSDHLWLPIVPYYEAGAKRLGLKPQPFWQTAPHHRWKELASLQMLHSNVVRWYDADIKPHESTELVHDSLDLVLPDGSIIWSEQHKKIFTPERARTLSETFASENAKQPPPIDPLGLAQFDRLLAFLKERGVDVYFVHPPFNPIYWDKVQGTAYRDGLARIEKITQDFAAKYDFRVFGSFDPARIGCTAAMYIDAEHANPECLGKVFAQFTAIDRSRKQPVAPPANDQIAAAATMTHTPPLSVVSAAGSPARASRQPLTVNAGTAGAHAAIETVNASDDITPARLAPRGARAAVVIETASAAERASRLLMPAHATRQTGVR